MTAKAKKKPVKNMGYTICFDFGSTYTKMAVLNLENAETVVTSRVPSTVKTDAVQGLKANLEIASKHIGEVAVRSAHMLASSSAAGGLRMVVVGLTEKYSLLAGMNTALGAGARVVRSYDGILDEKKLEEIRNAKPSILLLCGGTNEGNVDRLWRNAEMLAERKMVNCPVVFAGNKKIAQEVRAKFLQSGIECYLTENIFPELDCLNAGPAQKVIHHIFMNRITGMRGMDAVKKYVGDIVMPTPAAVLRAGSLLAKGAGDEETGIGSCMLFDVGGATTDVYSFSDYLPEGMKAVGAPEPFAKRSVEGDLGLRSSAKSLFENARTFILEGSSESAKKVEEMCARRTRQEAFLPDNEEEIALDQKLAEAAVYTSARRHCGRIENAYGKDSVLIQSGKNLTNVRTLIGTGGPIIFRKQPEKVLKMALRRPEEKDLLLPENADCFIDSRYLLFAAGLSAEENPGGAYQIAVNSLKRAGDG